MGKGARTSDGRLVYAGINQVNTVRVTGAKFLTAGEGSTSMERERDRNSAGHPEIRGVSVNLWIHIYVFTYIYLYYIDIYLFCDI